TGYCTYTPHFCEYKKYFSYSEMERYFRDADKVVCHGGPSTFMSVINQGKIPIVVPRLLEYEEHVNNHQLEFARKVRERGYPILLVENILELKKYLFEIDINIKKNINEYKVTSNNVKFVTDFIDLLKN
ncbi:glycosyltransferase, partial [Enterococcus raffinosus]